MTVLNRSNSRLKMPPVAPGASFVGSIRGLLSDPPATLYETYQQMGSVFRVKSPTRDYVVLAGPEANQFFLQHGDDLAGSAGLPSLGGRLGHGSSPSGGGGAGAPGLQEGVETWPLP